MMTNEGIDIEQLMLEKLAEVITEEDDCRLNSLLSENESYRARYAQLQDMFEKGDLGRFLDQPRTEQAWANVNGRIQRSEQSRKVRARIRLAAAITIPILVIFTGWYLYTTGKQPQQRLADHHIRLLLGNGQSIVLSGQTDSTQRNIGNQVQLNLSKNTMSYSVKDELPAHQLNVLEVPLTKTYQIVLSDGTEVWLNAQSSLKFPFKFSGNTREVQLSGEAYFKVAKDTRHPFIVHTANTDIRDLGTAFNVNAYDASSIMTSLVEGLVITSTKDGFSKKLMPGQQALFKIGQGFNVTAFDRDSLLSWRNGIYYFNHTPLAEIRPVIYRWFGKKLEFSQPELADYAFTGALFKDKSLKEFLDNLSFTSNIKYKLRGRDVYLTTHLTTQSSRPL